MKVLKWSKQLILIASLLVAMVVMGYWGAIQWLDFNRYKGQLSQQLQQQLGGAVSIEGEITASAFPLTFHVHQIHWQKTDEQFNNEARIKQASVALSLWSLFVEQRMHLTNLGIQSPTWIQTLRSAVPKQAQHDGVLDFKAVQAGWQGAEGWRFRSVALQSEKPTSKPASGMPFSWHFQNLIIESGFYELRQADGKVLREIKAGQLLGFDVAPEKPFHLSGQLDYRQWRPSQNAYSKGTLRLETDARIDRHLRSWELTGLQGVWNLSLPKTMNIAPLRAQFSLQSLNANLQKKTLDWQKLKVSALGSSISGNGQGQWNASPEWKGDVELKAVNLRAWARHTGYPLPEFVSKKALTKASGVFQWQATPQSWLMKEVDVQWDESRIQGEVWQQQLADNAPLQLNFDLQIDQLDLDLYQAKAQKNAVKAGISPQTGREMTGKTPNNARIPSPAKGAATAETFYLPLAIPVSTLRALQAQGHLQIGRLSVAGLKFQKFDTSLEADKGALLLAPFDLQGYGGNLESKLELDVTGTTPAYSWKGRIDGWDLANVWLDLKQPASITGRLNSVFQVATHGSNQEALLGHTKGRLRVELKKGRIAGGDLNRLVVGKKTTPKQATYFDRLLMDGKALEGIYRVKTLQMLTPRFKANGFGKVNLVTQALDLSFKARLNNPQQADLAQAVVPVKVSGTLEQPQWQVDVNKLLNSPENKKILLKKLGELLQGL